jgi:histone H3/H4
MKQRKRKNEKGKRKNKESKMTGIVVRTKIKEYVKDLNVAEEVGPALDKVVEELLQKAVIRAKANGRKTLQARDL